jgi:hypothetical protein
MDFVRVPRTKKKVEKHWQRVFCVTNFNAYQIPLKLLLPPRSKSVTLNPLYFVVTFANPIVGVTSSRDSPTNDFAVHVFPELSSPSMRM